MRKFYTFCSVLFLSATMLVFQNCSSHDENPVSDSFLRSMKVDEYNVQAQAYFQNNCNVCHSSISSSPLNSFEMEFLTENTYVVAGSPQLSDLYVYLIDSHPAFIIPESKPEIGEDELVFLRDWILLQDPLYLGDDILGVNFDDFAPIDGGGGGLTLGESLYAVACSACHGNLDVSERRGATAAQITNALDTEPNMAGLRGRLSPEEIQAIADALSN